MSERRDVTLRRNVQQVGHCVAEALSVIEMCEDRLCALDDLNHARLLLDDCIKQLKMEHRQTP